jgi:hypothetical protein
MRITRGGLGHPGTERELCKTANVPNAAASSSSGSGNNLTLNVALTFQAAFGGTKNIYLDAYDSGDSGFLQKGTWIP